MGFNIGRVLGGLLPIVGGIFGGPVGAAAGAALGAGFGGRKAPATVVGRQVTPAAQFPQAMTSVVPVPQFAATPGININIGRNGAIGGGRGERTLVGGVGRGSVLRQFGRQFGIGGGKIAEILADARDFTDGPVTKNAIIASAKVCGIDITSDTFGITDNDVCRIIVAGRTRRRRGISAADIRRTKRTIGFVKRLRKDLKAVAGR